MPAGAELCAVLRFLRAILRAVLLLNQIKDFLRIRALKVRALRLTQSPQKYSDCGVPGSWWHPTLSDVARSPCSRVWQT